MFNDEFNKVELPAIDQLKKLNWKYVEGNKLSPDEINTSESRLPLFSALLSSKVLIAGTNVITRKKAKNIPVETSIPKSFNSGSGDTILVKKPTIVASVAKVKAIPTDFKVEEVDSLTVFPEPISSLYLELKCIA